MFCLKRIQVIYNNPEGAQVTTCYDLENQFVECFNWWIWNVALNCVCSGSMNFCISYQCWLKNFACIFSKKKVYQMLQSVCIWWESSYIKV